MLFGLACEGPTDQITIENILCGYFENLDLDQEISALQPPFDETDQQQCGGGCHMLLKYLASTRFRDDVLNTQFVVLHIDTDIANKIGVVHSDNDGNELPIEILMRNTKTKLAETINIGLAGFYEQFSAKILFAISVHSLECWLVSYHTEHAIFHDCFDALKTAIDPNIIRVAKKPKNYRQLSEPFLIRNNVDKVAAKDPSFHVFINELVTIENQVISFK